MKKDLPVFPKFEKLSLAHKDVLQVIANNFPSSDFNFAGLFTWDVGEVVKISFLNENLVIRSSDYVTHEVFYSFIGNNKVDATIETIIDYAEKKGENTSLNLITETVAKNIDPKLHIIKEDRDNYDYIYLVKDLIGFKGGTFRTKRNLLNRFNIKYGAEATEKELDLSNNNVRQALDKVMSRWQMSRSKQAFEVNDELAALKKALDNQKFLNMRAYGVYHKEDLIAFTIFEILPKKVAIIHFDKADINFEGVFEHLKHNFAKHLTTLGVETINYEQDLGVEGLRKSKESYHPKTYIKKYRVMRRVN